MARAQLRLRAASRSISAMKVSSRVGFGALGVGDARLQLIR